MAHRRNVIAGLFGALSLFALGTAAMAQAPGQTRGQLLPLPGDAVPAIAGGPGSLIDYREEMRKLIQSMAAYARSLNPNFVIVVENGLELLTKTQDGDETRTAPALAYMRSINGLLVEGLSFGLRKPGQATPPERRTRMMRLLKEAEKARLNVLTADYTADHGQADAAIEFAQANGYIPLVAPEGQIALNRIPDYPSPPVGENPKSILSMSAVRNYLWITDSAAFGREDEYAMRVHGTNYDLVITEAFHGHQALSKRAVETLKYKNLGSKRLVLAHMDIGTAASYRYYWQPNWREGSPLWISAPLRDNPDRYWVEYWRPEWQQVISGGTSAYLYGIVAQGYDGVVLTGTDAYRFFEGTLREGEEEFETGPTGQTEPVEPLQAE